MERTINKVTAYLFLALALLALVGVLFFGAWWHLPSVAVCYFLYKSFKED